MKVTLIMPGVGKKTGEQYVVSWKMEPLPLAVVAGLTPAGVDVEFFDDRYEPIPYDDPTDLVGISVETFTARRSYRIAAQFRQRGVPVILGGYHPTLMPQEAMEHADSVMIGEAEDLWARVIEDAKNKALQKVYRAQSRPHLEGLHPRRELFKGKRYMPLALVESGRGCRFSCTFCSVSSFYNQTHNYRPIKDVVEEIAALDSRYFFIIDDNIIANTERTEEFLEALVPLNIRWGSQCSTNIAANERLLDLMEKSGCMLLLVGFESMNSKNLDQMNKKWNITIDYRTALKRIHDRGIGVYATFLFGYDEDTVDSFDRAVELAIEHKVILAAFNQLTPFPGTPLYRSMLEEKRLLYDRWWMEPGYRFGDVVFTPRHMTPEQLTAGCLQARRCFYRYGSIIKRGFNSRTLRDPRWLAAFFSQNLQARKEVERRQGIPVGEGLD